MSGFASNSKSWFYIPKIKGQCENALIKMGFQTLFIYRPGLLRCIRTENRPMEYIARCISNVIDYYNWWSISTQDLASVIVRVSLDPSVYSNSKEETIFEHGDITNLIMSNE